MLKKMSILILLLLGSAVFGSYIQPQVNDLTEITIGPSETVYLDLLYVYSPPNGGAVPGNISSADILLTINGNANFVGNTDITVHDQLGGTAAGVLNGIWYGPGGDYSLPEKTCLISATSWANGAPSGSIIFDHIGIHCDGPGIVYVSGIFVGTIQGGSFADFWDPLDTAPGNGGEYMPLTITQIPEPATIGLISLGCLLLKRRKNA